MATSRASRYAAAVFVASALFVGAGATVANAAIHPQVTTYKPTGGYQFASNYNNGAVWRVSNVPLTRPDSRQKLGQDGVTLTTNPAAGEYADSGVIVPVGRVFDIFDSAGNLRNLGVVGPDTADIALNLYIDKNADSHYLAFSHGGVYENQGGDQILFNVHPGVTQRSEIESPSTDHTLVWLWVGISGNAPHSATLTSVRSRTLVQTVLGPSVLTVQNVCRLTRQTSKNEWVVHNVAGDRDRTFHLGVTYQGRTTWTGLHSVAAGKGRVVITPYGGKAILQWFDGYGNKKVAYAYSDHTRFCG